MTGSGRLSVALVCLFCCLLVLPAGAAGTTPRCQATGDKKVCLTEVTVSDDTLVVGERGQVRVTVENQGSQVVTPRVSMNTAGPNNTTGVYPLGRPELQPGDSETLTQPLSAENPGQHGVQVLVFSATGNHRYDISEIKFVDVVEEPPTRLGGRIDASEISLVVLVVSLLGAGVTGYRYFGFGRSPDDEET
ncbi:MAG: hypothetical protein ABEH80_02525 [Halobaculum sp.]|jgi:hypothetical protein